VRKAALIAATATALVASAATVVPRVGRAGEPPSLARAANRTLAVQEQRFATDVEIARTGRRTTMHVRGAAAPGTAAIRVLVDAQQGEGAAVPVASAAALLDGPFIYVQAPSGIAVNGARWLRTRVADLRPTSPAMRTLDALTSAPLLHLLTATHTTALAAAAGIYRGSIPYDDPVVVTALQGLTDRMQFRNLQVTAVVGADGLVHRLRLTGRTPDGRSRLRVDMRLYAFGRPVHVGEPRPRAFLDEQELRLAT
jgi:hypothetical protein